MFQLEVSIDRHPDKRTLEALEREVGKLRHSDTPEMSAHYVVFLFDTEAEAEAAEAKLLELEEVNGTNIDDYEED